MKIHTTHTPLERLLNRQKPTYGNLLRRNLLPLLASKLQALRSPRTIDTTIEKPITVVCISDTHNLQPDLPDGDLLVHAGDLTSFGTFDELQSQLDWLNKQPHRYKIVIGGNHDLILDSVFTDRFPERIYPSPGKERSDLKWGSIIYLQNSSTSLAFPNGRKLNIFGSPNTPQYGNWAFQHPPIRDVWANVIPSDTDILLTHGPPKCHLDLEDAKGDEHLLREIWRARKSLKLAVFGHIHAGYGHEVVAWDAMQAAYEGIMMEKKGIFALLIMVVLVVLEVICSFFFPRRDQKRTSAGTILVNAASIGGSQGQEQRTPIVIEI